MQTAMLVVQFDHGAQLPMEVDIPEGSIEDFYPVGAHWSCAKGTYGFTVVSSRVIDPSERA
jgi:hypothetical protein